MLKRHIEILLSKSLTYISKDSVELLFLVIKGQLKLCEYLRSERVTIRVNKIKVTKCKLLDRY